MGWLSCLLQGLCLYVTLVNTDHACNLCRVTVHTGVLQGKLMRSRHGRPLAAFLKVPYAQPPLGLLRFAAPQDPHSWVGVRDATQDAEICTQRNIFVKNRFYFSGQEDCLYLNVYTPKVDTLQGSPLPVMVWFHGGGWVTGSGNSEYYPPGYLLDEEVVLVTLNYRLGPMGFLSMEDDVLPGNWGLKDQNKALQWVQTNIAHFGGNPDSVTIFGESAGGASVHYHILSPMSRGLFHRGISQSGTAFCAWAKNHPGATRNNTIKMAELVGCPTQPTTALVSCLRNKSAEDIILQDVHFMEWFRDPMIPFKPVVEYAAKAEDAFLPNYPEEIIRKGEAAQVPWMTGLNSGDGALRVAGIYDDYKLVQQLDDNFEDIVPMSLFYRHNTQHVSQVTHQLRHFYLGDRRVDNDTYNHVVDLWTDGWFLAGANHAVRLMADTAPVYYYYFSYRGTASFSSVFGDSTRDYGVCHADELIYLFPFDNFFPDRDYTEEDDTYTNLILKLWTNFARTGEPTPETDKNRTLPVRWTPVSSKDLEYLHLGSPSSINMDKNLLADRSHFWDSLMLETSARTFARDEL